MGFIFQVQSRDCNTCQKGANTQDTIVGQNGRILGIKLQNCQIWNIYPPSGSEFRKAREIFFNDTLCNLLINWKDQTKYIFQVGDHNCIYRNEDTKNNPGQHLQPALVKYLKINGLNDDFTAVHGKATVAYSRVTAVSATRIDYIFSNSNLCQQFEYLDVYLSDGKKFDHRAAIASYVK